MSYFACHICGQYKGMIGMVWHPCACPVQNQNKLSAPLPSSEGTVKSEQPKGLCRRGGVLVADVCHREPHAHVLEGPNHCIDWKVDERTVPLKSETVHTLVNCGKYCTEIGCLCKCHPSPPKWRDVKSETVPTRDIKDPFYASRHDVAGKRHAPDTTEFIETSVPLCNISEVETVPTEATKPSPEAVKMRKFVNEHMMATGRTIPFLEANLPDPREIHDRTVRLPTAQLVKFRNDYLLMIHFAALKCGVEPDELCPLHLLAPFMRVESEDDDGY